MICDTWPESKKQLRCLACYPQLYARVPNMQIVTQRMNEWMNETNERITTLLLLDGWGRYDCWKCFKECPVMVSLISENKALFHYNTLTVTFSESVNIEINYANNALRAQLICESTWKTCFDYSVGIEDNWRATCTAINMYVVVQHFLLIRLTKNTISYSEVKPAGKIKQGEKINDCQHSYFLSLVASFPKKDKETCNLSLVACNLSLVFVFWIFDFVLRVILEKTRRDRKRQIRRVLVRWVNIVVLICLCFGIFLLWVT
jgi:hypothetical protein